MKANKNSVISVISEASTWISDKTTLNKLIACARNSAVEKPKRVPKFSALRKNYRCVASLKGETFELYVYDCGYAGYESYGRTTVIDLDEISSVTYHSNYYDASFEASDLRNSPWGYALVILGDEQIELQRNKEKAHDFVFDDDSDGVSDYGCACNCGGESRSKKINQPAFAVHIDDPETAYIKKETQREIRWALSKTRADMTEKQAEAFGLYYDEDMTMDEVGETLGISSPAVLYRLNGAMKKLRKNMGRFL